jgi:hypothetical protein
MDTLETGKNIVITECGHNFHSTCLFENFSYRVDCPLCRTELVKSSSEEGSENSDEEEYEEDSEEGEEEGEEEDNSPKITCQEIADKLMAMGYTPADLVYTLLGYRPNGETNERYTDEFCYEIDEKIDEIINGPLEEEENNEVEVEDTPKVKEL